MPDPHNQREPSPEERFAQLVREKREALGWSQEELARRVSEETGTPFHQTGITRIEGGNRNIRLNEVVALARALGLNMRGFTFDGQRLHDPNAENALIRALETAKAAREKLDNQLYSVQTEMENLTARYAQLRGRLEESDATVQDLEHQLTVMRSKMGEQSDGDR